MTASSAWWSSTWTAVQKAVDNSRHSGAVAQYHNYLTTTAPSQSLTCPQSPLLVLAVIIVSVVLLSTASRICCAPWRMGFPPQPMMKSSCRQKTATTTTLLLNSMFCLSGVRDKVCYVYCCSESSRVHLLRVAVSGLAPATHVEGALCRRTKTATSLLDPLVPASLISEI